MAHNFKVAIHRNSDNLHLKLIGDFDGSSAQQLLHILEKNCRGTSRVFIHTNSLRDIHPFGPNVLRSHMDFMKGKSISIVFTGENASRLAPGNRRSLRIHS
jgi:anti-anti-sigma regulatory factor